LVADADSVHTDAHAPGKAFDRLGQASFGQATQDADGRLLPAHFGQEELDRIGRLRYDQPSARARRKANLHHPFV
jgi:hypothetical protein